MRPCFSFIIFNLVSPFPFPEFIQYCRFGKDFSAFCAHFSFELDWSPLELPLPPRTFSDNFASPCLQLHPPPDAGTPGCVRLSLVPTAVSSLNRSVAPTRFFGGVVFFFLFGLGGGGGFFVLGGGCVLFLGGWFLLFILARQPPSAPSSSSFSPHFSHFLFRGVLPN